MRQVEGFKTYLATAEADQLKFEEGEDIFSKYLPWAIIFELAERWAKVCADLVAMGRIPDVVPYWYAGNIYNMSAFNTGFLTSSLTSHGAAVPEVRVRRRCLPVLRPLRSDGGRDRWRQLVNRQLEVSERGRLSAPHQVDHEDQSLVRSDDVAGSSIPYAGAAGSPTCVGRRSASRRRRGPTRDHPPGASLKSRARLCCRRRRTPRPCCRRHRHSDRT